MKSNRTAEATAMLAEIGAWCKRTGTPETSIGHALYRHPGFVALARKRLQMTEEKEREVREFLRENPQGFRGKLPYMFSGTSAKRRHKTDSALRLLEDDDLDCRRVYRDPCPRCGVRGDINCGHSRVPLGTVL